MAAPLEGAPDGASKRRVAHVLGPSRGGMRRHVRYVSENPPPGYETLGVWSPDDLREYFGSATFHRSGFLARMRPPDDADVIHAHGFEAGLLALRFRRSPVVLTAHIDLETQGRTARSRALRTLARVCAARADAVIAVSDRAARRFPKARVIAPAVDALPAPTRSRAEVRAELGSSEDRVVVVTVARLHPDKGLHHFVDAVAASGAEGWICGDGPLREELERLVAGTSVRLLGYRDDVENVLGAADMFALPSVGEAYGIAVVEAIAAGLPVVVSAAGAMPEIAGDAGLAVKPGDAAAFSAAVTHIATDDAFRRKLAENARRIGPPVPAELVRRIGAVYDEVTA